MARATRIKPVKEIGDLQPDKRNARRHGLRNVNMITDALREVGAARSVVIDEGGRVLAGNGTVEAALAAGIKRVHVVDADGETLIAVRRRGLSKRQKDRLALYDNRTAELAEWEDDLLAEYREEGLLDGLFEDDELDELLPLDEDDDDADKTSDGGDDTQPGDKRAPDLPAVPDALWPTDNDWGVPLLDMHMQAQQVDLPALTWGSVGRKTRAGTWLFYTEDYRYTQLWKSPNDLLITEPINAAEPNFSCYEQMPRALALWRIYQKRWLARYWQERGVRILVDLNVAADYYDLNWLGVPPHWRAYATRGYGERLALTEVEFAQACERAGTKQILFVVYGGGQVVKQAAQKHGWVWVPEHMTVQTGLEQRCGAESE